MQVADILNMDPAYVVACMHAQRAKHENEKKLWERIAGRMSVAAMLLTVAGIAYVYPHSGHLPFALLAVTTSPSGALYIMSNAISIYWPIILPLFILMLLAFPSHNTRPNKSTK